MINNTLSNSIENWLLNYNDIFTREKIGQPGSKIVVSDAAGKLAFLYEKIRNTVDYKEDHLLRKHAIVRMIKRLMTAGKKGSDIALPLIEELIRARYLANNAILENVINPVRDTINKYIVIYNSVIDKSGQLQHSHQFLNWLINLAACEIEAVLVPADYDQITVNAMHRVVKQNLILDNGAAAVDETQKNIQIYIAILKSLVKADEMTVNYYLIKYYFNDWNRWSLTEAADHALEVRAKQELIKQHFSCPLNERLAREFKQYTIVFWILQDIIANHHNYLEIFQHQDGLIAKVKDVCQTRYKSIGAKVRRAIIRSVIYIFCTKMIFGLLLELPYDYFILNNLQWLPLGINAIFPPLLMAFIGLSIKTPKKDNTDEIIAAVNNIVYNQYGQEHRVKIQAPKKGILNWLLQFFYFITYIISFGLIIYGLYRLHFSPASTIIFLFFLTMISFFSLRIRKVATELIILKKREKFLPVMITFLFVPILRVGRWISLHSSRINVFIFVLDFIIEAPFKMFIKIFEDLIIFVKEKRDEIM